jgi:hypothetical protein
VRRVVGRLKTSKGLGEGSRPAASQAGPHGSCLGHLGEDRLLDPQTLGAINDAMAELDQGQLQGRGILIPASAA